MPGHRIADFRSDTVTRPTARMLEAMTHAQVGDDVLGDDPTVQELERRFADLFGKEAALFNASGTMSNQAAVAGHILPGEEVLLEANAHIFEFEGGGLARIAGAHPRTLPGARGCVPVELLEESIRRPSIHEPRTGLICLEQTHLYSGGSILPFGYLEDVRRLSVKHQIPVHLDGARIFNAHVETGVSCADYGRTADSISISLCKGLSCPVGSMLVGSGAFIERARRARKWMGGGMRQAGYLAACGLVALEEVLPLISEDNARCRRLGGTILGLNGLELAQETTDTNILMVNVTHPDLDAPLIQASLEEEGLLTLALKERLLRIVTHRQVNDADVERLARTLQRIVRQPEAV